MRGKFFLDTNILIYTFDASAPDKQKIARQLVATALHSQQGVISYQVVQEFLNVASRKFSPPLTQEPILTLDVGCNHLVCMAFWKIMPPPCW